MSIRLGYCCINTTLKKKPHNMSTNRGMIKRTFAQRGYKYALELAHQNSKDLVSILEWNQKNEIDVFRIGAGIFPWHHLWFDDHFNITELYVDEICKNLTAAGKFARSNNIRLSTHPDHFVKLASIKPNVVKQSILDLEIDSMLFDLMDYNDPSPDTPINIHIGQGGDHKTVAKRFCDSFKQLSPNLQKRLVVENDDKINGFSVQQLFDHVYNEIGIPITFDYFHHQFHPDGLTEKQAFNLAYSTWTTTPLFHYSESKSIHEGIKCNPRAHSDYVVDQINTYGKSVDIDLEAKAKELALFKYRKLYD